MNFFFGINNKYLKCQIKIPIFKNNGEINYNLKLFSCNINSKAWEIKKLNLIPKENFFYLNNDIINDNKIFFLAEENNLKLEPNQNLIIVDEIKKFNNFTETEPQYRSNIKIFNEIGFSSYQSDYPFFNPYTDSIKYDYYHGYTLFEKFKKEINYHFGHGESYSNFEYSNLKVTDKIISDSLIEVSIDVKNTSNISGKEIVQLYVGFSNSKIDRPLKLLRDFFKININPKEKKKVFLEINIHDLAWYNNKKKKWEIEDIEYEILVGGSSDNRKLLKSKININKSV